MSGHAVYQTLLQRLIAAERRAQRDPDRRARCPRDHGGAHGVVAQGRAVRGPGGLLATQDPPTAFRVHMQLASGGHLENLDPTSFFAQGQEYDDAGDLRDSVLKLLLVEARSHLFGRGPRRRAPSLGRLGEYTCCLAGSTRVATPTPRPA